MMHIMRSNSPTTEKIQVDGEEAHKKTSNADFEKPELYSISSDAGVRAPSNLGEGGGVVVTFCPKKLRNAPNA